jgi:hypothetical protein
LIPVGPAIDAAGTTYIGNFTETPGEADIIAVTGVG